MSGNLPEDRRRLLYLVARFRGPVELGWYDFTTVFRRSYLGPIWTPIQLAAWVGTLVLLFSNRLGEGVGEYALYVGIGMFAWEFLSTAIAAGPAFLTGSAGVLRNTPIDISIVTVRRLSMIASKSVFQLPVPIFLIVIFGGAPTWHLFLLAPVAVIFLLNAYSILTILGVLNAFMRDLEFLTPTVMRFLFFATPIFWKGDEGFRKILADYNPFSYFLEIVRATVNGEIASLQTWVVVGVITALCFSLAIWLQQRFRSAIIYRL
ncbi:MAG: ABC transporter permease [Pseudomonadota bacterium]